MDYSTIQYILEVMNYRNPRVKEQLPASSLLTLGHLGPLPHHDTLGQHPLQTLQFPQNLLCIKMVFQSWNGDMRMQHWWTLMSPPPTCSRMIHACFCHIYVYGERHSSSSSERCLMRFSSKLSWCQSFLSLTIPAERFLFLRLR